MKVIEEIISGYVLLKDRKALERVRDHRSRLLNEMCNLSDSLQHDLKLLDLALIHLEGASAEAENPDKKQ
ncbi:hypothetical protein [Bradyrhizobium sp. USDA 4529]